MSVSIVVVDDMRPIAEGFAGKFRRFSTEKYSLNVDVEVICTSDEAVRRISDASKPKIDLLFTDIDLSGGVTPDHAGVALARYVKTLFPAIPLVGCSGRFEEGDLSEDDRKVFDKWWSKSGLAKNLTNIADDTIRRAYEYHKSQISKQCALEGMANNDDNKSNENELYTPKSNDDFMASGYKKIIIEPTVQNELLEPFAVWMKAGPEGVELEVVGCGALFSWGDNYDDAEVCLLELIKDIKQRLNEPDDSFVASLLLAKRFVETVTGSRNMKEEK
jgi:CheY-like chemotaxis protein